MGSFEKIQEKLSQGLIHLKDLNKDGRDRSDARVKEMEDQIRAALGIPNENWVPRCHSLTDLIENISNKLQTLQDFHISSEKISDTEVLKNASGGLALDGVYLTKNLDDVLGKREQLIEVPESFSLKGPEQSARFEQKDFTSHEKQSVYQKTMERFGFSFRSELKIGLLRFSFENTVDAKKSTEEETTSSSTTEQCYIHNTKYNYIPLASCNIPKDHLRLSAGALRELREIETLMLYSDDSHMQRNRIGNFFTRFGSHVSQGPIHFGGVFWWRASAEGFDTKDLREMRELTSEALNVYVGGGYSGLSSNFSASGNASSMQMKGSFKRKHNEEYMSLVQLTIQKTGGPSETDDHFLWKTQLASSNKTWSVIDRGTTFSPVWEIVTSAHRQDFKETSKLGSTLMEVYKHLTDVSIEQALGGNILQAQENVKEMLQVVNTWTEPHSDTRLAELLSFKNKLKEQTKSDRTWIQACQNEKLLQDYLLSVTIVNEDQETANIRALMRALIEPIELKNCPSLKKVIQWAYKPEEAISERDVVSDFPQLIKILQHVKNDLEQSQYGSLSDDQLHQCKQKATYKVTLALNSLFETFRNNDEKEAELLILCVVSAMGYNQEMKVFSYLLDLNKILFLQRKLPRAYEEYCKLNTENTAKAQAYLFLTAMNVSSDEDVSPEHKNERAKYLRRELRNKISNPVATVVEKYQDDPELLEGKLKSVIKHGEVTEPEGPVTNISDLPTLNATVSFSENPSKLQHEPIEGRFAHLCQRLGLSHMFPKNMMLKDILVIKRKFLNAKKPETEEELVSQYFYKLIMLDYSARFLFLQCKVNNSINEEDESCHDEDFFNMTDDVSLEMKDTESHIHPMDIQMAIFHCANDSLRQYLFTKLTTCQFALPFLVPNPTSGEIEFPLWPLRNIKKSWKSTAKSGLDSPETYKCSEIFNTPVPIVSFIRLGTSSISKSQLLNCVINKQRHNVFYTRHCEGSTSDGLLMNGTVEIAWYCPGGKKNDIFDNCVAFLNLHGNAVEHPRQFQFLQEVTTVNVLLLPETPLDAASKKICTDLYRSRVPLICLFSGQEKKASSNVPFSQNVKLAAKNRNEAELRMELITNITLGIQKYEKSESIETCSVVAQKQLFLIDEDKQSCKDGRAQAEVLMCLLREQNLSELKKELLPLQGSLWHDWCKKNKEQYRLQNNTKESIEQQLSRILTDMEGIRGKQRNIAYSQSEFVKSFLQCLSSEAHSEETKFYMLQWLRLLLDELTADSLAQLEQEYHSIWSKVKQNESAETDALKQKLNKISNQLSATTVGLQHIMREIGQMYEAMHSGEHKKSYTDVLPAIGAEMLISGYPVELMDGDAAHVPLVWIQAVMDKLIQKLGNKKVYVLSVLGLQSSGKSTLLNAMFGLQFTVSAGRCTRGAFMQLLTVDSRDGFGYDFVLVVDTEGLRSPELSTSVNHDNELATFIIGIGDMTVINIMGENPSEMQDILQICVQAFLRMKQVKIKPSCIFVHQNVSDASAGEKNMEGRRRLLEKLDNMARIAAKEERIEGISRFSDIIKFDVETHVFYFKSLLEGDPPMAPPNPSYSQNVQDLKNKVLTFTQKGSRFSSLSEFRLRVGDLWNALLQENFVFSFRNTVEMMVYSNLETQFSQWSWKIRKHALKMQYQWNNKIGSNLAEKLNGTYVITEFDEEYVPLKSEIEKYFQNDKYTDLLIQWKTNIDKRFESLRSELVEEIMNKCKAQLASKKDRAKLDQKKSDYERELTKKSKALASTLKDRSLSEKQVEEHFDHLWVQWVAEVTNDRPLQEKVNVQSTVESILVSNFPKQNSIVQKVRGQNRQFKFIKEKHVTSESKKWYNPISWLEKLNTTQIANQLQNEAIDRVKAYVDEKENQKIDFMESFIYEILQLVEEKITEHEKKVEKLEFTPEFRADLSIHVCFRFVQRFQRMHDAFREANNLLTYMQSKREQYLELFKNCCKGASSVKIFADFLFKTIKPTILEQACANTCVIIADKMKTDNPAFSGARSNIEKHIQKDLAEKEDFSLLEDYIDDPKSYFETFINETVEKFCTVAFLQKNFMTALITLKDIILPAITEVTEEVKVKNGNVSLWLDKFCEKVGKDVKINKSELQNILQEDIRDFQFLKDMLTKSLNKMCDNEKKENERAFRYTKELKRDVTKILCPALAGCWARCPFCGAVCTNTIANHDTQHTVRLHRSEALHGWHWSGTNQFTTEFCTTLVGSNVNFEISAGTFPYKTYWNAGDPYNKWNITADGSTQSYWKWFLCTFQSQWEKKHGYVFAGRGALPPEWRKITKASALNEL